MIGEQAQVAIANVDCCGYVAKNGGWSWWAQFAGVVHGGWAPDKATAAAIATETYARMERGHRRPA